MQYFHPTKIINFQKSILNLREYVNALNLKSNVILIITGSRHFNSSLFKTEVDNQLVDFEVHYVSMLESQPGWTEIRRLMSIAKEINPGLIIGIGGGSVLDSIKPVATLFDKSIDISEVMNRKITPSNREVPIIAIPTTSGTGSEVTPFSVITNEDTGVKQSIGPVAYFPDIALVDSRLNLTVPEKTKLDVGLDTMAHALEALWAKKSQYMSDTLAWKALRIALENIEKHIDEPENLEASQNMSIASNMAGVAFSNTFTAVCHGLSFPLGKKFNLTHGEACSWTLPACIELSEDILLEKASYSDFSKDEIKKLSERIRSIRDGYYLKMGVVLPSLSNQEINYVVENAFTPLLNNWMVDFSNNHIVEILKKI